MPRQTPPLNALRAFEAAGRHESISRAAEELSVSHSAISRHVRGLEARLGVQLFREAARGVALTEAGQHYLELITPAFDAIAEATETLVDKPVGVVDLSCEPLMGSKWLIPRLPEFQAAHPDITVRVHATGALADVARFEADIALRFHLSGAAVGPATLFSNAPLYPYMSPDAPFPLGRVPEDLLHVPRYQDRVGDPWRTWFRAAGVNVAKVPEPGWRLRAILAFDATLLGQGAMLVSEEAVSNAVARGQLVAVSDVGVSLGAYHLLCGEGVLRRKAVRLFWEWLLDKSAPFRF